MTTLLVLNVDDDLARCTARTALLQKAGYRVKGVHGAEAALKFLETDTPDFIVLDVNIPEPQRLALCRQLKGELETSSIPILQIIDASDHVDQQVATLESGADSFLFRPVDDRVFLATLRSLLRLCRVERDLVQANQILTGLVGQLESANEALKANNEELQRFSYMATHDLQTPLRAISSFATLLRRQYRGRLDEKADEYLDFIHSGVVRMAAIIQDLLHYAQSSQEGSAETVLLSEAIQGTLQDLRPEIEASGARIYISELPTVKVNPTQIIRVFQNLVGNAVKYRKPDEPPEIKIQAFKASDGFWQFQVIDNGIGVDEKYQQEVFLPFRRLHGHELPGTGIGLATCRRIVEKHGGKIWLESVGEGSGSTFCFTLPDFEKR